MAADAVEVYEVICRCGGAFTVRLAADLYGCVRCCAEVHLPPLWLDLETGETGPVEVAR